MMSICAQVGHELYPLCRAAFALASICARCSAACDSVTPANAACALLIASCTFAGRSTLLSTKRGWIRMGTPSTDWMSEVKPSLTACCTWLMVSLPLAFGLIAAACALELAASEHEATRSEHSTLPISWRSTFCTRLPRVKDRKALQPSSPAQA